MNDEIDNEKIDAILTYLNAKEIPILKHLKEYFELEDNRELKFLSNGGWIKYDDSRNIIELDTKGKRMLSKYGSWLKYKEAEILKQKEGKKHKFLELTNFRFSIVTNIIIIITFLTSFRQLRTISHYKPHA